MWEGIRLKLRSSTILQRKTIPRTRLHFLLFTCLPAAFFAALLILLCKMINQQFFDPITSDPGQFQTLGQGQSIQNYQVNKGIVESSINRQLFMFNRYFPFKKSNDFEFESESELPKILESEANKCQVTIVLILCNDKKHIKSKMTKKLNDTENTDHNSTDRSVDSSKVRKVQSVLINQTVSVTPIVPVTAVKLPASVKPLLTLNVSSSNTTAQPHPVMREARNFQRQLNQTIVLLKSIAIQQKFALESPGFSKNSTKKLLEEFGSGGASPCVNVLILSDEVENFKRVQRTILQEQKWSSAFTKLINLTFVPVRYPPGSEWMKKLFRPCATLRLFLADLLPQHDSVIYLDTDIILLDTLTKLWTEFDNFGGPTTLAAMAPCLNHYGSKDNAVPYYGKSGLNAGIMLMNLTRMRSLDWTKQIQNVTSAYIRKIKLADQDILNIYFHSKPEEMHELTCDWNFRPFNCRPGGFCQDFDLLNGISALHGNALSFTVQGPEPLFYTIFSAFQNLNMTNARPPILLNLYRTLKIRLQKLQMRTRKRLSDCSRYGAFSMFLLKRMSGTVERVERDLQQSKDKKKQ